MHIYYPAPYIFANFAGMTNNLSDIFLESLHNLPSVDPSELAESLQSAPATGIRLNTRKATGSCHTEATGMYPVGHEVEWCAEGWILDERPSFTLNPLFHAGVFYVQDPSSMIYGQIATRLRKHFADDSIKVLDFCAAPGGKTTALINALKDNDLVVANEFVAPRGKILRENLQKWGFPNIITTGDSSNSFAGLGQTFDIVAVDAPCSGEGMMRKDEEARRQWSPELVRSCAALQREILGDITRTITPGGFLIYSTCTFNIHENEENSRFIAGVLGLEPISIHSLGLTGIGKPGRALLPGVEALRFMPHLTSEGEGLYVSIFRKPSSPGIDIESANCNAVNHTLPVEMPTYLPSGRSKRRNKDSGRGKTIEAPLSREAAEAVRSWLKPEFRSVLEQTGNEVFALPEKIVALRDAIRNAGIRITSAGVPAAELKGSSPIPDSRLVLSDMFDPGAFPSLEVDETQALRYLRRESFPLPGNISKGFVVIKYKGHPLGLMKNIGSRANNLYPLPWRIHI